jgi:hypothetical protein
MWWLPSSNIKSPPKNIYAITGKRYSCPSPCNEDIQGRVDVEIHSFLTSALDEGEWSTSHSGSFTPGKQAWCLLNRTLGVPRASLDVTECVKIVANPECIFFWPFQLIQLVWLMFITVTSLAAWLPKPWNHLCLFHVSAQKFVNMRTAVYCIIKNDLWLC